MKYEREIRVTKSNMILKNKNLCISAFREAGLEI